MEEWSEGEILRILGKRSNERWRKREGKVGETRPDELTTGIATK
jgi:hypothetical protein